MFYERIVLKPEICCEVLTVVTVICVYLTSSFIPAFCDVNVVTVRSDSVTVCTFRLMPHYSAQIISKKQQRLEICNEPKIICYLGCPGSTEDWVAKVNTFWPVSREWLGGFPVWRWAKCNLRFVPNLHSGPVLNVNIIWHYALFAVILHA